nr:copia protein [Tanacetum cinerariifolium]
MGCCLTSWFSKKQAALSICTAEAEYVSTRKACQQALWMKQALVDYDIKLDDTPVLCDNKGAINLSKNLVLYSRTKHIEIRHHFLRDNVQKGNILTKKISFEDNIADILNKPLKREPFNLRRLDRRFPSISKAGSILHMELAEPAGERKPKKGQNQIKTRQKQETWQNREKSEAVTVDRGRKTEENAKRRAKFANSYKVY